MNTTSGNLCFDKEESIEELLKLGIIIIDKPRGPSSHQVAEWARNILGLEKSGHLGTLDSNVSGVLPVLLGKATNTSYLLMQHDKEYIGIIKFNKELPESELIKLFEEFTGEIWQIPPIGAAVARVKRKRMIYSLRLLEIKGKEILFDVKCEAGTYIRTLAEDMGEKIGGAKLIELRRINVGGFSEKNAISLQELSDASWLWKEKKNEKMLKKILHPIEDALTGIKKIWVNDKAAEAICNGAQLMAPGIAKFEEGMDIGDNVVILNKCGKLIAFGEAKMSSKELKTVQKGQVIKTKRVIMERKPKK